MGLRWLETHLPAPAAPVLCHHDFRTGNYLLDGAKLTGILDWEFAGWGDPHEDIGWFCSKGWRFARLDREAGGIADRAPFYRGYESESGRRVDPERVRFWEVLASVRWAVIALQQSDRHHARRRAQPRSRADRPPRERMRARNPDAARSRRQPPMPRPMRDLPAGRRHCWRWPATCCSTTCCRCCRPSAGSTRGSSPIAWRSPSAKRRRTGERDLRELDDSIGRCTSPVTAMEASRSGRVGVGRREATADCCAALPAICASGLREFAGARGAARALSCGG